MLKSLSDGSQIIREARRYVKKCANITESGLELCASDGEYRSVLRIAILGSRSLQYISMTVRYLLHTNGFETEIFEGSYDGLAADIMDSSSDLYAFQPDYVLIFTHAFDIHAFPNVLDNEVSVENLAANAVKNYQSLWNKLSSISDVQVLQTNFVIPPEHVCGIYERKLVGSRTSFYERINQSLEASSPPQIEIIDAEMIASDIGKYAWFDYPAYFSTKAYCRIEYIPELVRPAISKILADRGRSRKCLVLDLDNTLWGGVVGDTGWDGILLDPSDAVGEAYRHFQQYLLQLKERGVILAVCSKNEESAAREPFDKNPDMILKTKDIACFVANWEDKASNIRHIAAMLNIGIDSMVFFDDNPAERELIRRNLPEVAVVDVPEDPAMFVIALDRGGFFDGNAITREDIQRTQTYASQRKREELAESIKDYDAYLRALDMKADVHLLKKQERERFTQLLNKTNQFNLRTVRYTESEINSYLDDPNYLLLAVRFSDRFSTYGIVSALILKQNPEDVESCFIESWVMSCRVFKRGLEHFVFNHIVGFLNERGCKSLMGEYIRTEKNGIVSELLDSLGFRVIEENPGMKNYALKLEDAVAQSHVIGDLIPADQGV